MNDSGQRAKQAPRARLVAACARRPHGLQRPGDRDPAKTGREDVKRTLNRWEHPNSRGHARAVLVSFYDWCMEEGIRETNPARQTRKPKRREARIYRLRRDEVVAMMRAAQDSRERRVIYLGFLVGARNAELRSFQRAHFERPGVVQVIGKGDRQRWVPVLPELEEVVCEVLDDVAAGEYVLPARRARGGNQEPTERVDLRTKPTSAKTIGDIVARVGIRAGIAAHVHPHLMRHAFGDHITRAAGIRSAQAAMGHANLETTTGYIDAVTVDELVISMGHFRYDEIPIPLSTTRHTP